MKKVLALDKVSLRELDLPAQNKMTGEDYNELKDSANSIVDSFGWVEFKDTINTEQNKQQLTASQDNIITINAGQTILAYAPLGGETLWDSSTNKISPINLGDSYMIRVDFDAQIASNDGWFDFKVNIGGSIGTAFGETKVFPKGQNVSHKYSLGFPIYTLGTFIQNGGSLIINPSHTMQVYNKRIIIFKIGEAVTQ